LKSTIEEDVSYLSSQAREVAKGGMIPNCVRVTTATAMAVPSFMTRRRRRPICFCSSSSTIINTEQLRSQLDHLHAEADTTRTKGTCTHYSFLLNFIFNLFLSLKTIIIVTPWLNYVKKFDFFLLQFLRLSRLWACLDLSLSNNNSISTCIASLEFMNTAYSIYGNSLFLFNLLL